MSLWYKQPELITFDDIETFCTQQIPEGIRLDYKCGRLGEWDRCVAAAGGPV
jgi:hypothetical protein